MATVLFDDVVYTDYGQFTLEWGEQSDAWDGDVPRFFGGQANGLVGVAQPNNVVLVLGRRSGGSSVGIELHDAAPELRRDAEDVVEVSIAIPAGRDVWWRTWAAESEGKLAIPSGEYRLRVSATGRDAGQQDEFADGVVDHYRLELWPAPKQSDEVLRVGSTDAAYWHGVWGGQKQE